MNSPLFGSSAGDCISGSLIVVRGSAMKHRTRKRKDEYYFTDAVALVKIPVGTKIPKDLMGKFELMPYKLSIWRRRR